MILVNKLALSILPRHSVGPKPFRRRSTGGAVSLCIRRKALTDIAQLGLLTLQAYRKERLFALFGFTRKIIHGGAMKLDWFEYYDPITSIYERDEK